MFAQSVVQCVADMTGKTLELDKSSFLRRPFYSQFRMISYIKFAGNVQGGYILCLDETTALKLIDAWEDWMDEAAIREMRREFGGFVGELLNISVGQVIVELETYFDGLTYESPTIVYGEIEMPAIQSGSIMARGDAGEIQCGFILDFSELKIGRKYKKSLQTLETQQREINNYRKDVEKILEILPCCLLAVSMEGKILPGFSLYAPSMAGYSSGKKIEGLYIWEFLKLDDDAIKKITDFFFMLRDKESFLQESLIKMCDGKFINKEGKKYKLEWLPVMDDNKTPEKLMVIVKERNG